MFKWINKTSSKKRLGIALSGGGAKGIAHIGVLKALEEHNIYPDIIAGTSMGSLVGVLYAYGKNPDEIAELIKENPISKLLKFSWQKDGFFQMNKLKNALQEILHTDNFKDLKKEFYLVVTNLNDAKAEVINSGKLIDYVIASCSVPIFFTPQHIDNKTYIDGGIYQNLPIKPILNKCKKIIAVDVVPPIYKNKFTNMKTIAERSFELAISNNDEKTLSKCDFIISVSNIDEYSFWDFTKVDELVQAGYECAMNYMQEKPKLQKL